MDLSNWDMDNMIPKGTSHTSVPNSTFEVPKGTIKTRFEPSLPRMSALKNNKLLTKDSNPGPLHQLSVCRHWTIKARYIIQFPQSCLCEDPSWGNKSAKSVSDRQDWQSLVVINGTNIDLREHLISCFSGPVTKYFPLRQRSWVQIQEVFFMMTSLGAQVQIWFS
jgi:hypothetical protein